LLEPSLPLLPGASFAEAAPAVAPVKSAVAAIDNLLITTPPLPNVMSRRDAFSS
jgi:hypothetical protein